MDARDHANQQLYEILEDLLTKANKKKRTQSIESLERTSHRKPAIELNEFSLGKNPTKETIVPSNETVEVKDHPKMRSLKELLTVKENLVNMKTKLEENPRSYKQEITRLNRLEEKLNANIRKTERREITYALDFFKKDPKRIVLQLVETKNKIEQLKRKLEENPRKYKHEVERVNHFEQKWQQKIDKTQSTLLKKAIYSIEKNPKRHKEELDKYQEIESKLKQGLDRNQLEISHYKKNHEQDKAKSKQLDLQR